VVSTEQPVGGDPGDGPDDRQRAAGFVDQADGLIAEVLRPGRWPQARTVARFMEGDRLERVLALYARAMRLEPNEPAYPWNLASTLRRLGLYELALGYLDRAIRIGRESGDDEWSGAGSYLALAETAEVAGHDDIALTALARAKALSHGDAGAERHIRRVLAAISERANGTDPVRALTQELSRLTA
jgi:tetratricopeptide (TPR) repeat protein